MADITPTQQFVYGITDTASVVNLQTNTLTFAVEVDAAQVVAGAWTPMDATFEGAAIGSFFERQVAASATNQSTMTVRMNPVAVISSTATNQRAKLMKALQDGTDLTVSTTIPTNAAPEAINLTLRLRALSTVDFFVSPTNGSLSPAYNPGFNASLWHTNATPPAGSTFSIDFAGAGTQPVTHAGGVFSLPAAVGSAAAMGDPFNRLLTINRAGGSVHELVIDMHVASDTVVLMDRSGSMTALDGGTKSRWQKCHEVSSLFARLLQTMVSTAQLPDGGTIASLNKVNYGAYYYDGATQVDYTQDPGMLNAGTGTLPDNPAPAGATPIVDALKSAAARLVVSGTSVWKRRHIVLVTDGLHNSGTGSFSALVGPAAVAGLPRVGDDAGSGVTIHTISFAPNGATDAALDDIATNFGGGHFPTSADDDPTSLVALWEVFMDVMRRVVPLERAFITGNTFAAEDFLDRLMVVAEDSTASPPPTNLALQAFDGTPYGPAASAGNGIGVGSVANFKWITLEHPEFSPTAADVWTVTAGSRPTMYALFDLSLRMSCGVERTGLGDALKVWATVSHFGRPVSGAKVRATLSHPGESVGKLLTEFVGKLDLRRLQKSGQLGLLQSFDAVGAIAPSDAGSVQRALLDLFERERNLPFQFEKSAVELVEVTPGRYEAELSSAFTQAEGPRTFYVHGEGETRHGGHFARDQRVSTELPPIPDSARSRSSLASAKLKDGQLLWSAQVYPITKTGNPVGPGLAHALTFQLKNHTLRDQAGPLITIDNLDGSYSTQFTLTDRGGPPELHFGFGNPDNPQTKPLVVQGTHQAHKVSVILEKVQVLDDKDGCLTGKGELVFESVVAPEGNPNRAVKKRIPVQGHLHLGSGQTVELDEVIFEGLVEAGEHLDILLGGADFDWFLVFSRKEPLARYHRLVATKPGTQAFAPGDESGDPEALADWKVWYRVEVS